MTREDLLKKLAALKQHTEDSITIWRQVVNPDGTHGERIYCGSFRLGEPSKREQ